MQKQLPKEITPMKDQSDYLTPEEIDRLLAAFKENFRNYLITRVLIRSGMRISELLGSPEYNLPGLCIKDIDWENALIEVLGKGKKPRTVRIDKDTLELLRQYCQREGIQFGRIFKLRRQTYADILKRKCRDLGLRNRKTKDGLPHPHTFRHTLAVNAALGGANPIFVRDQLGHSSLEVTDTYFKIRGKEGEEQYGKFIRKLAQPPTQ